MDIVNPFNLDYCRAMNIVSQIIDKVGVKRLCCCLDVRATAISNAKAAQAFPARWFLVLRALAVEVGIDVEGPEFLAAFTFIDAGGSILQLPSSLGAA